MIETINTLAHWTPYLMGGFAKNIEIALGAMLVGTLLGSVLALLKFSKSRSVQHLTNAIISFFRNVPTLVILFYLATLVPNEIGLFDDRLTLTFSPALKASIALASSPLGFTAWNLHTAILSWKKNDHRAAWLFVPNWMTAFLVTMLASSVSSLVGVDELVGRSNTVIGATDTTLMIPIYLYAMLYFFCFCYLANKLVHLLKDRLTRRLNI